jgi:UDP-2,3-diacylglucosamine pyrophosphatase LpxH
MRTLILSDLHLGNDGAYDIFAGRDALPALLEQCCNPITRVVLNGDAFDFLLDDEPLGLSLARAVAQARAIVGAPSTARVLEAMGRLLAAGGEVVIRLGNHDVELALSEVQDIIRAALQQPTDVSARLQFERGDKPAIIEVGGVRILVAHGEHNDPWNRLDYDELPGPGASVDRSRFRHPPGSMLVKSVLNPLKKQYGMRFADLLKPDFRGAVLTALAVDPGAVKLVFQQSNLSIMWQLLRRISGPASFAGSEPDMGLADALDSAALGDEEREALAAAIDPMMPLMFGPDDSLLDRARLKLARAGLALYASFHRAAAAEAGAAYFALAPEAAEWDEARRLAHEFGAQAVIIGHTHAARFQHDDDLVFVNTGTWIWLMQLPQPDADDQAWIRFLEACRKNPGLDPDHAHEVPLVARFTGCLIEPHAEGGASIALVEYQPDQGLVPLHQRHVAPASRR